MAVGARVVGARVVGAGDGRAVEGAGAGAVVPGVTGAVKVGRGRADGEGDGEGDRDGDGNAELPGSAAAGDEGMVLLAATATPLCADHRLGKPARGRLGGAGLP